MVIYAAGATEDSTATTSEQTTVTSSEYTTSENTGDNPFTPCRHLISYSEAAVFRMLEIKIHSISSTIRKEV